MPQCSGGLIMEFPSPSTKQWNYSTHIWELCLQTPGAYPWAMLAVHLGGQFPQRPCGSAWSREASNYHLPPGGGSHIWATQVYCMRGYDWRGRLTHSVHLFTASCQPMVELKARVTSHTLYASIQSFWQTRSSVYPDYNLVHCFL